MAQAENLNQTGQLGFITLKFLKLIDLPRLGNLLREPQAVRRPNPLLDLLCRPSFHLLPSLPGAQSHSVAPANRRKRKPLPHLHPPPGLILDDRLSLGQFGNVRYIFY
jgi:hypothetical protein